MDIIRKLPIPISGLILASLSLGNLLQDIHPYLRCAFGAVGTAILILMILKIVLYPQSIKEDFKNPIIVSSSGTFSMSLMLLSTYLVSITPSIAYAIWIIGVVLHILLVIYFTYHFIIRKFDISTVYPSYWIIFVGITMASITGHFHGLQEIDFIFFIMGFIGMLASTPIIFYREFVYKNIPDMNKPLTCIFTALFSILIFGYLNSASSISNEFVMGMYVISCAFYIFSFYKLIRFINIDFYPSFSAFTFPFVISALATKGVAGMVWQNSLSNGMVIIETVIATILVVYVLLKYIEFLKNS
jgi:exfoliative toxin A/B